MADKHQYTIGALLSFQLSCSRNICHLASSGVVGWERIPFDSAKVVMVAPGYGSDIVIMQSKLLRVAPGTLAPDNILIRLNCQISL